MLNKLLKRCLPWMDKGRWYKIVLEPDEENETYVIGAGTDPDLQNVDVAFTHSDVRDSVIIITGSDIIFRKVMIRAFFGKRSTYNSALVKSRVFETIILMPAYIANNPVDGQSIEILAFGG